MRPVTFVIVTVILASLIGLFLFVRGSEITVRNDFVLVPRNTKMALHLDHAVGNTLHTAHVAGLSATNPKGTSVVQISVRGETAEQAIARIRAASRTFLRDTSSIYNIKDDLDVRLLHKGEPMRGLGFSSDMVVLSLGGGLMGALVIQILLWFSHGFRTAKVRSAPKHRHAEWKVDDLQEAVAHEHDLHDDEGLTYEDLTPKVDAPAANDDAMRYEELRPEHRLLYQEGLGGHQNDFSEPAEQSYAPNEDLRDFFDRYDDGGGLDLPDVDTAEGTESLPAELESQETAAVGADTTPEAPTSALQGSTAGAPGNLPVVDLSAVAELPETVTNGAASDTDEDEVSARSAEREETKSPEVEPTDEELKTRLNKLLKGDL